MHYAIWWILDAYIYDHIKKPQNQSNIERDECPLQTVFVKCLCTPQINIFSILSRFQSKSNEIEIILDVKKRRWKEIIQCHKVSVLCVLTTRHLLTYHLVEHLFFSHFNLKGSRIWGKPSKKCLPSDKSRRFYILCTMSMSFDGMHVIGVCD